MTYSSKLRPATTLTHHKKKKTLGFIDFKFNHFRMNKKKSISFGIQLKCNGHNGIIRIKCTIGVHIFTIFYFTLLGMPGITSLVTILVYFLLFFSLPQDVGIIQDQGLPSMFESYKVSTLK